MFCIKFEIWKWSDRIMMVVPIFLDITRLSVLIMCFNKSNTVYQQKAERTQKRIFSSLQSDYIQHELNLGFLAERGVEIHYTNLNKHNLLNDWFTLLSLGMSIIMLKVNRLFRQISIALFNFNSHEFLKAKYENERDRRVKCTLSAFTHIYLTIQNIC